MRVCDPIRSHRDHGIRDSGIAHQEPYSPPGDCAKILLMGECNGDSEGDLGIACESKGLDACFQSTALGVALLDSQLRYVRINSTFAALNRHPPEAHVGQKFATLAPLLAEFAAPRISEVLATRRPLLGIQIDD